MNYKHTQISYPMIAITLIIMIFFIQSYLTALAEPPSYNSGPNLAVTTMMTLVLLVLASFTYLQVNIDDTYLKIKFGYGLYQKKFLLNEIISATEVKNHWYYGWGIRLWLWPKMWIYNISGLDAIEIKLKNNKVYRIGTDEPNKLKEQLLQSIK